MSSSDVKAVAALAVAAGVGWFAIHDQLAPAAALAIVGLAAIYARNLLVLAAAAGVAAVALFVPSLLLFGVLAAAIVAMFAVAVQREVTLGPASSDRGGYGGGFDGGWGGGL